MPRAMNHPLYEYQPHSEERRARASDRMKRKLAIKLAIFDALGCTKLNYKKPQKLYEACGQITRFVEDALDELEIKKRRVRS